MNVGKAFGDVVRGFDGQGADVAYYAVKLVTTAAIVVAVSELAKRFTALGALLASLPLVSLLAMIWLYVDTGDRNKVATLSTGIFWLVLPSLALFLMLPALLRASWGFWTSLAAGCAVSAMLYLTEVWLLQRFGVTL